MKECRYDATLLITHLHNQFFNDVTVRINTWWVAVSSIHAEVFIK